MFAFRLLMNKLVLTFWVLSEKLRYLSSWNPAKMFANLRFYLISCVIYVELFRCFQVSNFRKVPGLPIYGMCQPSRQVKAILRSNNERHWKPWDTVDKFSFRDFEKTEEVFLCACSALDIKGKLLKLRAFGGKRGELRSIDLYLFLIACFSGAC